ncbi:hypothetical protein, partial [Veillonella magna]|uniref:hypothetical protein n=1 Tax=Veillonella magna TaxID=464322 RepID=UPI00195F3D26
RRFLHRYAVICVTNLLLTDDFSHENTRRLAGKLIQGVILYNVPIDSYWIFPVSFKTLFTVLGNDINAQ